MTMCNVKGITCSDESTEIYHSLQFSSVLRSAAQRLLDV